MEENAVKKVLKKDYIFAVGRRKSSVARVRVYTGKSAMIGKIEAKKGEIFANGKRIEDYFREKIYKPIYQEPLRATNNLEKFVISVKFEGGGLTGQLGAFVHGLSRALSIIDKKNREILKKKGFLTRDARIRERRKVGMGGKARRKKQSPKR